VAYLRLPLLAQLDCSVIARVVQLANIPRTARSLCSWLVSHAY